MNEPAIACSLNGGELAKRYDEIADLCNRALIDSEPIAAGLRLRFAAEQGIREELEQLIAAESRCCSFLRFELDSPDGDHLLVVTGPAEARPLIEAIFGTTSTGAAR